ncbi:uncharacterized protein LOC129592407 [Paramacrobiotus metropolitanus]|uniref:uncharacterized protein LOC129592407 n=1 Tax=Paramacrobiotus metropolitanus TaxID=2943436 RepID=UPI002445F480|nr:uncharacterized protein LOC129592407 [Paramacrobiotus metropolitanus]
MSTLMMDLLRANQWCTGVTEGLGICFGDATNVLDRQRILQIPTDALEGLDRGQPEGAEEHDASAGCSSSETEPEKSMLPLEAPLTEQHAAILRLHNEEKSHRQIAKLLCVSTKTIKKVLVSAGMATEAGRPGRKLALTGREEEALVEFLLALDQVNLNWTWPLLHKLLEIVAKKKDPSGSGNGSSRSFSSKWLLGFSHRHRKKIALRVVDSGLSGPTQNKQRTHPGRMDCFEEILRRLYTSLSIPDVPASLLEVQEMWVHHVESPKTRKVFARKGRKNVRLTIAWSTAGNGNKKRTRRVKPPAGGDNISRVPPGIQPPLPAVLPPISDTALRIVLQAIMRTGYTEEDAKQILRDINVPI